MLLLIRLNMHGMVKRDPLRSAFYSSRTSLLSNHMSRYHPLMRVLLAVQLICMILFVCVLLYGVMRWQYYGERAAYLGRGGAVMNIWIPAQPGHGGAKLTVYTTGEVTYWGSSLPITRAEWQAIEALRRQWCQSRPSKYPLAGKGTPVYDVVWICSQGLIPDQMYIPANLAPSEVTALVERLP